MVVANSVWKKYASKLQQVYKKRRMLGAKKQIDALRRSVYPTQWQDYQLVAMGNKKKK